MIPCVMENNYLVYAQSVKGDIRYYGGEQALLIYSKKPEDLMHQIRCHKIGILIFTARLFNRLFGNISSDNF